MKLVRTLSMIIALAGASTVYADTPAKTPPAEKKAPEADKKAPAKEEMTPAEVKQAEAFFNAFYDAIMKNKDACPKMGAAINAVFDKNQAWLEKMAASNKDMPQSAKDKLQAKQGEMMGAVMSCKDDKAVQAAMQRFASMGAKKKEESKAAPPPPAKK